ncbi:MAG: hypothetical protein WC080_00060 [Patescibacteria group bacterium]|jgi:hypothetical protein
MHTSYPKGTTIWIKYRTGEVTTGKFADHKSGKVLLGDGRVIALKDIRAMSIRKLKDDIGE